MTGPVAPDARLLGGRYLLLEHLGSGGMGTVHRGHDRLLDRPVAVKLLHDGPEEDDVRRARLQAEARFAGGLRHPALVQVYDYGEDGGTPYVVMELVEGRPLSEALQQRGPLPPAEVAQLVAALADGLAAAHARGTIHRDLKPANIILTEGGAPVLVDFGVARTDDAEPLTRTGEIVGTADYLSPEQVRGQRATGASDVYALGVVAHQCLTSTSPFRRDSRVATALAHLNDAAPPLPAGVPGSLRRLVDAMLAREPGDRPTAAEVARRARVDDEPPTESLAPPRRHPRVRRLPRPVAVAAAAAVLLVAGVVVAVTTDGDPAAPPAAAELAVPDVRGEQVGAARRELDEAGFDVVVRRVHGPRAAGLVLAQSPRPGRLGRGDDHTVTLRVASGWVRLDADTVVGRPYAAAAAALERLGLRPARAEQATDDAPPGQVLRVAPTGLVPVGASVTLTVARAAASTGATGSGPARPHAGTKAGAKKAVAKAAPAAPPGQAKKHGKAKGKKHGR